MRIGGLHKTTLLDFPGKVSALVFTQGCNFHCPYCHNPALLPHNAGTLAPEDVLAFLQSRRSVLEGVVLSGGEPTLQEDLSDFCTAIKNLGYAVKLDTNGSNPHVLKQLLRAGLLDYVAMDIKANPAEYSPNLCVQEQASAVVQSIAVLEQSGIPHELRIPCAAPFITEESFAAILACMVGYRQQEQKTQQVQRGQSDTPIFLQYIHVEHAFSPAFFQSSGRPLCEEELLCLQQTARAQGFCCHIR